VWFVCLCEGTKSAEQRRLVDAQKYQLMDLAVQPAHQDPLIVLENHRYRYSRGLLSPGGGVLGRLYGLMSPQSRRGDANAIANMRG